MTTLDDLMRELDIDALKQQVHTAKIEPRDYQWFAYNKITLAIRRKQPKPVFIDASVGAGKTIIMGMVAKRAKQVGLKCMILAHQKELVDQNSDAIWELDCPNSIFCASSGHKKTQHDIIVGSEKSVLNALPKKLSFYTPDILLIDECHRVDWRDALQDEPKTSYGQIIKVMRERCFTLHGRDLRIIGFTGSPYRGTESILGDFWDECLVSINTEYLVDKGFLVPTIFSIPDEHYDLERFKKFSDGTDDYTKSELEEMQEEILSQGTRTQKIMLEVVERTKNRNGVLITCAGRRHCVEASKYLPEGTFAIIDGNTPKKEREKNLQLAKKGLLKYVLQVDALTTGVDVSYWDTSVILRKIGSLTLYIQLLGRGMRLAKASQLEVEITKDNHLVLDFTDTTSGMYDIYTNPILERAELERAKKEDTERQICPMCNAENSLRARRCVNHDYWFQSRQCEKCGEHNDVVARICRSCDATLIDPNEKLNGAHYKDSDLCEVRRFDVKLSRDATKVIFEYHFIRDGESEFAKEVFNLTSKTLMFERPKLQKHIDVKNKKITAQYLINNKHMIQAPTHITHRKNPKGYDVIAYKKFGLGDTLSIETKTERKTFVSLEV